MVGDERITGKGTVVYLEDDAEEPGKEDVAGHKPCQLPPVLLAVTDPHDHSGDGDGGGAGQLGSQQQQQQPPPKAASLNSGLHQPMPIPLPANTAPPLSHLDYTNPDLF